jgi:hypothetical protein
MDTRGRDGVGFVTGPGGFVGSGFVNIADRLGAVGERHFVETEPGRGTTVRGEFPAGSPL